MQTEPYFGLRLPERCPEVPTEILDPKRTWEDAAAYDLKARTLAAQFHQNFDQFREKVTAEVAAAGPVVGAVVTATLPTSEVRRTSEVGLPG